MAKRFYYAGNESVALTLDALRVAVDVRRISSRALSARVAELTRDAMRLPGGMLLVERQAFRAPDLASLEEAGALHSVYRHGSSTAILLPEVRIEVDEATGRRRVDAALAKSKIPLEVVEDRGDLLVVRPTSNSGEDALDLANYVFEKAKPAAAAPRMVQVVPRPDIPMRGRRR